LDNILSSITEEETRLKESKVDDQRADAVASLSLHKNRALWKKRLCCEKSKHDGHTINRFFKIPGLKKDRHWSPGAHGVVNGVSQTTLNRKGSGSRCTREEYFLRF
jgi:hypothetical protein